MIEIWTPRFRDRKVLIATYKVQADNYITFTKAKYLKGKVFYVSGEKVRGCEIETNGSIDVYAVPMKYLEQK